MLAEPAENLEETFLRRLIAEERSNRPKESLSQSELYVEFIETLLKVGQE